jgi:hypothetical protein
MTGIHISDASINTARFHSSTPLLDDNTDGEVSETDLQLNEESKPRQGVTVNLTFMKFRVLFKRGAWEEIYTECGILQTGKT